MIRLALKNTKKSALALIGVAALSLTMAGPALADPSEIEVEPGTLGFAITPDVGDLSNITLDGTTQTSTATISVFKVTDATGSGAGWRVQGQATQFAEWDTVEGEYVAVDPKLLPTSSLSIPQLTATQDGTSSTAPVPATGAHAIDVASPVTLATAAVDTGMGRYTFDDGVGDAGIQVTLTIAPNAYAATYRSDVTISLASGPS
jgi:hypothetical protein